MGKVKTCFSWYCFISVLLTAIFFGPMYVNLQTRSYQMERQDMTPEEGKYTWDAFFDMMKILAKFNGDSPAGYNATLDHFDKLVQSNSPPKSVLEVGFGLGDFSLVIANRYPETSVLGIDSHELSVKAAQENYDALPADTKPKNVRFEMRGAVELNEPENSVDIVTTIFVNHHIFPDEAFVDFLQRVSKVGRQAYIFNDYFRSFFCFTKGAGSIEFIRYVGIENMKSFEALFKTREGEAKRQQDNLVETFRSDRPGFILQLDSGVQSMKRAFSLVELHDMFRQAGYPDNALQCDIYNDYPKLDGLCRVACTADLTWTQQRT